MVYRNLGENWAKARRAVRAHLFLQRLKKLSSWHHKSAYFEEKKVHEGPFWFILLPEGIVTRVYNTMTALAVMYVGFSIFLTIGFANYLPPYGLFVFEKALDVWFWIDMCLNFITAFYHEGKLVVHPSEVFLHYFQTWFLVDLFGNLPLEQMTEMNKRGSERKVIKILKFLKIPRLLRLARLRRILQGKGKYVTLIMYFCLVCLGIHAAGCLWMLLLDPCGSFPPHCTDGLPCAWDYLEDIDPSLILSDPQLGPECLPTNLAALYTMALAYGTSMVLGYGGIDINSMDGGHYRTREASIVSMADTVSNSSAPSTLTIRDLINVSPFPPNSFGDPFYMNIWILSTITRLIGYVVVAFLTGVILKLELNAGYRETMFRRHVEAIEAELHS